MTLPLNVRPNPDQPIPNSPFYSPPSNTLQGATGPLVVGSNLSISPEGVISATGGGSAASIFAGTGISVVTNLAGQTTISNTGVLSLVAGPHIAISSSTGNVTISTIGVVTGVTGSAPIVVTGTTTPNISVSAATTLTSGVVQLNNTVSSTSSTAAATANAVKIAYDAGVQGQTDAATAQSVANAALPVIGGIMSGNIAFAGTQTFPVSGIQAASTTQVGVVQLYNAVNSTSTTLALTAAQGKNLQDQIDALAVTSNVTLAGTLDASTGLVDSVTAAGTAAGFVVGSALPAAAAGNTDYFVIVDVPAASYTPPGGSPTQVHIGDWFLSSGTSWQFLDVGYQAPAASLTTQGIVQLEDSVTSTSVATAAVPNSVKTAYDAAVTAQTAAGAAQTDATQALADSAAAQTDATQALADSAAAQTDATQALADSAIAQGDATQALADSAAAQTDATQALTDSAAAQTDANQALLDAAAAQTDATQALADAATAQATAAAALPKAGGVMTGDLSFSGAGNGVVFDDASTVEAISDSTSTTSSSTAASSTAVKSAKDAADTAQTDATQALTNAAAAQLTANAAIPKSTITAIGDLIVGNGVATYCALTVGSDSQVLTADSACVGGLKWGAAGGAGTVTCVCTGTGLTGGPITGIGTISLADTTVSAGTYTNSTVVVDAQGRLTSASCGATPVLRTDYPSKGALLTATAASTTVAIPVGTNNQVLTADSACTNGLKWATAGGSAEATPTVSGTVFGSTLSANTNTNLGWCANNTGACSVSIGQCAGFNATCPASVHIGFMAGCLSNNSGAVFIGTCAGKGKVDGIGCTVAIGSCALANSNTGILNVAVGGNALRLASSGAQNTAIGWNTLNQLTTGAINIAIGSNSGREVITGSENILMLHPGGSGGTATACRNILLSAGQPSTAALSTGCLNVFIGQQIACSLSTGQCNVAIGSRALEKVSSGQNNVAIGTYVGFNTNGICLGGLSTGSDNVLLGTCSGESLTSGSKNIAIGWQAGCSTTLCMTSGNCNVLIGPDAQVSVTGVSNEVTIYNGSVCARFQGAATVWNFPSDVRDKESIEDLPLGLDFIEGIQPRKFKWNTRNSEVDRGKEAAGFIAQEVLQVTEQFNAPYTGLVNTNNPDQYTFASAAFIPMMVNAIKELSAEVKELKNRLRTLEGN